MKVNINSIFLPYFICYDFTHGLYYKDGYETCKHILEICEDCEAVKTFNKNNNCDYKCTIKDKVKKHLEGLEKV
jgi:hypothetical protein